MSLNVTYRGTVYQWHCDQMGHMNVMWYVGKFDEATWNFFLTVGISPSYLRTQNRGMVAVQQTIAYKRELLAGDVIEIRTRILEVGDKRIRFEHEMRNAELDEVAAVCELIGVHINRETRKSCPFPTAVRAAADGLLAAEERKAAD
jgi:acyl-CoA thioester hydrolase